MTENFIRSRVFFRAVWHFVETLALKLHHMRGPIFFNLFFLRQDVDSRRFHQINLNCMVFVPQIRLKKTLVWLVRTENQTTPQNAGSNNDRLRWEGERLHCRVLRDGRSLWANSPQVKDGNKMGGRYPPCLHDWSTTPPLR